MNSIEIIEIKVGAVKLKGDLEVPKRAGGLIIFSHGSGSGRLSPRNQYVAKVLNERGFATLLFDLLTEEEDESYENRFDIDLLTERLEAVTKWCRKDPRIKGLLIGYFGASTGAASALKASANTPEISAVVSRGGRPDLAGKSLGKVKCPVLLIAGGSDTEVIGLNELAAKKLAGLNKIEIVPGATHLFEEPGTLEKVAQLAADWFKKYL